MSTFFREGYEKLNDKISELREEVNGLKYTLLTSHIVNSWETIGDLMKEIQEDFKSVRYPTRQDRDSAWQEFFELRQEIFLKKNQRFEHVSGNHKDMLFDMLGGLEYWQLREGLRQMFFTELNVIKAEVIENGKKLNEAGKYFSSVKHEMTGDDKSTVFNKIKEIRESHDEFWTNFKDRSQELHEAKEDRRKDYEERQERKERAKNSLIENIENNREKLEKAEHALAKQELHRDDLEEKLESAYSDSFRERCDGWLDECKEKISDIESYIDKLKSWIYDGEDRLRNWD
ncbi:hypothetical protein KXD93_16720 [Mucilaginibacter sp. BJC16-A38]|uniref:hypothetical protein n=1 Tax=Mucilaginibacter phenanthrenivorans TaxID=1234842 RepID=UPI0021578B0F|nr:hypothetical protein [Mucilaginibacter phenanthrenivorans]MCR8559303.1 hypothetical protein [Mucilaginibacter phenanthrenivorans]